MLFLKYLLFLVCLIEFCYGEDPIFISRNDWNAKAPKKEDKMRHIPPEYVVIHHSATPNCNNLDECKSAVKSIQNFHMNDMKFYDIGYNFLIGGDGNVYVGRGWNIHGAHLPALNSNSIGICLLGSFDETVPNDKQLKAAQDLIGYAVKNNYVTSDYKLVGHRQKVSTICPGDNLYSKIVNWPHWTNDI